MGMQMHIYGDSILKGIIMDHSTGKYVPMQGSDFDALSGRFSIDVVNKSKFGYTVDRGWSLLSRALQKTRPCDILVMEYGGNDCNFDWKAISDAPEAEHLPKTTLSAFCDTMRHMIAVLREKRITPVLVSLPPIDAERYLDYIVASTPGTEKNRILSWLGDVQMIYRFQELYSSAVTRLAYETGSLFVDIRSAFLDKHHYASLLCRDGIHPNEEGHKLIAAAFSQAAEHCRPMFLQNA